jgi:rubrerythrin
MSRPPVTPERIQNYIISHHGYLENDPTKPKYDLLKVHMKKDKRGKSETWANFKCNVCGHLFSMRTICFLNGQECPQCDIYRRRTNIQDVLDYSISHHGYLENDPTKLKYDVFIVNVKKNKRGKSETWANFKCNVCGHLFSMRTICFLTGQECPQCNIYRRRTNIQDVLDYSISHHGYLKDDPTKLKYDVLIVDLKDKRGELKTWADFKCNVCGHLFSMRTHNFFNGKGCPRCNASKAEQFIMKLLEEYGMRYGIDYEFQKPYEDLVSDKGVTLPFDIYFIRLNILLEYDGEFHFNKELYETAFPNRSFEQYQYHDRLKNEYAKKHGIRLIRIRYDEDIYTVLVREGIIKPKHLVVL